MSFPDEFQEPTLENETEEDEEEEEEEENDEDAPPQERVLPFEIDNYEVFAKLTTKLHSACYEATNKNTKSKCVIKYLPSRSRFRKFKDEKIEILGILNHSNIVSIERIIMQEDFNAIVMPFYKKGDLYERIFDNKKITLENASKMMWGLVNVVKHMHCLSCIHGNISLSNILVESKTKVIITGFSMATMNKFIDSHGPMTLYTAPEVETTHKLTFATDVFALGTVFYYLLMNTYEVNKDPSKLPQDAQVLLSGMVNPNPKKRFTIFHVASNKFFYDHIPEIDMKNALVNVVGNRCLEVNTAIMEGETMIEGSDEILF